MAQRQAGETQTADRTAAVVVAVASLAVFLADGATVVDHATAGTDRNLELGIHHDVPGSLHALMLAITTVGGPTGIIVLAGISAVAFVVGRVFWAAFLSVVAPGGGALLETLTKDLVRRPRPYLWPRSLIEHGYSFPSGHATASMAFFAALTYIVWRLRGPSAGIPCAIISAAIVLLIGFSRVYLGVHWPTDILGGWTLALGWVALLVLLLTSAGRRFLATEPHGRWTIFGRLPRTHPEGTGPSE